MNILWLCLIGVVSYLIGSISSAIIVGWFFGKEDIRTKGSGNAGATNALRNYGKKAAAIVTLGDCSKAVVSILLAMLISNLADLGAEYGKLPVYIAGIFAVLGHNFPIYFGFRGGKGVLVSLVAMLFANWWIGLIVFVASIAIMAITKYVSLGSILGSILLFVLSLVLCWGDISYIIFCFILALSSLIMHRENIKRLLSGTENKLGNKKK